MARARLWTTNKDEQATHRAAPPPMPACLVSELHNLQASLHSWPARRAGSEQFGPLNAGLMTTSRLACSCSFVPAYRPSPQCCRCGSMPRALPSLGWRGPGLACVGSLKPECWRWPAVPLLLVRSSP